MLNVVKGLKITLISFIVLGLIIFTVIKTENIWHPQLILINQVLYGLFFITIVFSSHFSRSRLAFITASWVLFYVTVNSNMLWSNWVLSHPHWLWLSGCFVFGVLSLVKDRGVFSIHGLSRVLFICLCGLASYIWLLASDWLIEYLRINQYSASWYKYLRIELPLVVISLLLFWRSVTSASLLVIAIFGSFLVWCLHFYQLLPLPWGVILTILVSNYLLVVVIDSYFLAYRDELTSLPSRRALKQLSLSLGRNYTVAMLDIDHFKKFNDTYGHDIGDQVLKLVASKLAQVKIGGKVFRYGGEEFTIVFPRKNKEQTLEELERIRQLVADYKIIIRHPQRQNKQARHAKNAQEMKTVSVTISIGVATRENKQSFEQTLKFSDQALYRAKKKGRNIVSI